mmetsp:Transcript_8236/g.17875  ORF Transcript_8236/g.17875 Transcript_8236/m.17875 type:complete len:368 (-) Transcript_8236:100-1203(-)
MKTQNLICCATLAYVNPRMIDTRSRRGLGNNNRYYGSQQKTPWSRLRLNNGDYDRDHARPNNNDLDRGKRSTSGNSNSGNTIHNTNEKSPTQHSENINSRRSFLSRTISKSFLLPSILLTTTATTTSTIPSSVANAACLSGDIRTECIGIYKLPIDAPESPYVASEEQLKLFAPDLKWVPPVEYPSTYGDAVRRLNEARSRLDEARELIAKGDMEGTGLVLLDVIPKVSASGYVILRMFGDASNEERNAAMRLHLKANNNVAVMMTNVGLEGDGDNVDGTIINNDDDNNPSSTPEATALELKAHRIEVALGDLVGTLGDADITVGQGLRGELGVSAPAQIEILGQLADCRREFDVLMSVVPERVSGL